MKKKTKKRGKLKRGRRHAKLRANCYAFVDKVKPQIPIREERLIYRKVKQYIPVIDRAKMYLTFIQLKQKYSQNVREGCSDDDYIFVCISYLPLEIIIMIVDRLKIPQMQ